MTPSQTYRSVELAEPPKIYSGIDATMHGVARRFRRREQGLASLRDKARRIHQMVAAWDEWSQGKLESELRRHRSAILAKPAAIDALPEEAVTAIVEAARRKLKLFAHEEQIMASLAMLRGELVEVATGEGKTLAIAVAVVAMAWTRRPCHVVTANDYLAERDATYLERFFELCGVSVGFVNGKMGPEDRRKNYAKDIVYTTAKELAADHLRDELAEETLNHPGRRLVRQMYRGESSSNQRRVLRGLHAVIVDEGDNGLIDEAVTPLIISQSAENKALQDAAKQACEFAAEFELGIHYRRQEQQRSVKLLEPGFNAIRDASSSLPGIWQGKTRRVEMVIRALEAREYFHRDKQYVVEDEEIVIVDESTGRRMPGRSWRQGLHQAVEAKEGVPVTSPAVTIASISFQRFFRQFQTIAGATGTAREAAGEFWRIYGLRVTTIPLHKPCQRRELRLHIEVTREEKWDAVIRECTERHANDQPILVGTRNVHDSEVLSERLREKGLPCQVLNAIRHRDEAAIIAGAGRAGRITIATNMAGRGTDIKLEKGMEDRGGLCVIATELHDSGRVDRQLYGRSGRQGDPGIAMTFVSFEDELAEKYLSRFTLRVLIWFKKASIPGADWWARRALKRCQKRSEKTAFKRREAVLKADEQRAKSLGFTAKS